MDFDWNQYLNIAHELIGLVSASSTKEAKQRASISRAYYAAFNCARFYLIDNDGKIVPRNSAHTFVMEAFLYDKNPDRSDIGANLEQLMKERQYADYDRIYHNLERQSKFVLNTAKQTVMMIQNLPRRNLKNI